MGLRQSFLLVFVISVSFAEVGTAQAEQDASLIGDVVVHNWQRSSVLRSSKDYVEGAESGVSWRDCYSEGESRAYLKHVGIDGSKAMGRFKRINIAIHPDSKLKLHNVKFLGEEGKTRCSYESASVIVPKQEPKAPEVLKKESGLTAVVNFRGIENGAHKLFLIGGDLNHKQTQRWKSCQKNNAFKLPTNEKFVRFLQDSKQMVLQLVDVTLYEDGSCGFETIKVQSKRGGFEDLP